MDGSVTAITIDKVPPPAPTSVTATAGNASANRRLAAADDRCGRHRLRDHPPARCRDHHGAPAARSYVATGLTNGTSYTYSVKTLSPDGSSAPVSAPAVVPKAPVTVPSAPTITATTLGSGSVTVTWTAPATGGSAITGYQLLSGSKTLSVGPTVRKATLTGLAKNTKIRVGVRAKNAVGWSAYAYSPYVTTKK